MFNSQYDLIRDVARDEFGFKVVEEEPGEEEWDIIWFDFGVGPRLLQRMQTFQRVNHFPGMYNLARKNHLGRNLMKMRRVFP